MNNQQIAGALYALCPGALWFLSGDDLTGLQWQDQHQTQPSVAAITAMIATQYAAAKQQKILVGGITVNVGTQQSPSNVEASTDPASLILLQGAYSMATANNAASFQWVQSNGAAVTLSSAQVITIFNAVTTFIQATFNTLAAVTAAIGAGTITTTAQIDAFASPAWPANS